jgi:hypothetical protein
MRFQNIVPFLAITGSVLANAKPIAPRQVSYVNYASLYENIVYATNQVTKSIKAFENNNSTAADYLLHETAFVRDLYSYFPGEVSRRGNVSVADVANISNQLGLLKIAVDKQLEAFEDQSPVLQQNNWHLVIKQSVNDQYLGSTSLVFYVLPKLPSQLVDSFRASADMVAASLKRGVDIFNQET